MLVIKYSTEKTIDLTGKIQFIGELKKMRHCLIYFSLVAVTTINAAEPMVPASMSTDRGGTKTAIEAYSDGGGVMLYTEKVNGGGSVVDNSAMNELVFKYGENAKVNNTTLQNQVKTIDASTSTVAEKALADQISMLNIQSNTGNSNGTNVPANGTACDDGNANTTNDIYTNGVCKGTAVASNDVSLNTAPNGLKYDNCEGGLKNYADAVAYCSSKGMRLPTLSETTAVDQNGVIFCGNWTWTSTIWYDNVYRVFMATSMGGDYDTADWDYVRCVK